MKEKTWIMPTIVGPIQAFVKSLHDFPPSQKGSAAGLAEILSSLKEKPPED
jgi:hypothetical protein